MFSGATGGLSGKNGQTVKPGAGKQTLTGAGSLDW